MVRFAEHEMRRRALQSARFSVQPYYAVAHSLEALGQFLILGDGGVTYSRSSFDEGNVVTLTNVYISLTAQTIAEVETRPELLRLDFQLLETQPNKLQMICEQSRPYLRMLENIGDFSWS